MKQIFRAFFFGMLFITISCTNTENGFFGNGIGSGSLSGFSGSGGADERLVAKFQSEIGDRVFFDVDQSTLNSDGMTVLDSQAEWLISNRDYKLVVEGHADERGTREYNLALGARRANSVKEYLISLGVSGERLQTVTYGKERPIKICSAERCYSENRRAVSVLNNLEY